MYGALGTKRNHPRTGKSRSNYLVPAMSSCRHEVNVIQHYESRVEYTCNRYRTQCYVQIIQYNSLKRELNIALSTGTHTSAYLNTYTIVEVNTECCAKKKEIVSHRKAVIQYISITLELLVIMRSKTSKDNLHRRWKKM